MSLPLKDFRPAIKQRTHTILSRIARARGVSLQELGREIIELYVEKALHDAKVILGQIDDNAEQAELFGNEVEEAGTRRSGRK